MGLGTRATQPKQQEGVFASLLPPKSHVSASHWETVSVVCQASHVWSLGVFNFFTSTGYEGTPERGWKDLGVSPP